MTRAASFFLVWVSVWSGVIAAGVVGLPGQAQSAPAVDLHELTWYVHIDLIDAGAGQDLAYWQGVIDAAVAQGNQLLEGRQGPADRACCTRLDRSVSVATFGSPGDGLDVIDSASDQNVLASTGGSGSKAFLVDSLLYCGGAAPNAIGCGIQPGCNGNPGDDPNLWMIVTADAIDDGVLPSVIAHERGHNSCLMHAAGAACQLMQASIVLPADGGCLTPSECSNYRAGRTTTSSGLECGCHVDATTIEPDGAICTDVAAGLCSGGLCGAYDGDAGVRLIGAAAPGSASGGPPDDALAMSALAGDWSTLAQFAPTADDVRGMAYAYDSGTLFGVVPTVADDLIVTIDATSGTILAFVGSIANGAKEFVSMAYDPGATSAPGDDRLLVLEAGGIVNDVFAIDPASPSTVTLLGSLVWGSPELFTGLAYDSNQGKLYAATPFGPDALFEIDLSTCPPSPCVSGTVAGSTYPRDDASLAYSPISGTLYLVGTSYSGTRTFYDVIDPMTGESVETRSVDVFTPAGLAAVPESAFAATLGFGVLGLAVMKRRRARSLRCNE
jgi:hypothetical protein